MDMERVDNTASSAQPPVPRGTRNQDPRPTVELADTFYDAISTAVATGTLDSDTAGSALNSGVIV